MSFFADTMEERPQTGFFVPDFLLKIEGKPLDPNTRGDVLSIKLVLELEKMTSATIKLNNWDDQKIEFKYSDLKAFFVESRAQLEIGYVGNKQPLLVGQINSLAPDFPEKGASTLTIGILDRMQLLKDRHPVEGEQRQFLKMSDGDIAKKIAERNQLGTDIDPGGEVHDEVVQGDDDDAAFLIQRARRNNFDCYIYVDNDGKDWLRFGAPRRSVEHKLEWGRTLRSFVPTLTLSGQVSKVTVRGWNPDKKAAVVGSAEPKDLEEGKGKTGADKAKTGAGGRQDVVIGASVQTEKEAKDLALSLLKSRVNAFITGKAAVIGRPDIRPGDKVTIANLGSRFSGTYDVTRVEHSLDDKGFTTSFDVRKTHVGEAGK